MHASAFPSCLPRILFPLFSPFLCPPELIPLQIHIFHCHASGLKEGKKEWCFTGPPPASSSPPSCLHLLLFVYSKHNVSITLTQEIFQSVSVSEMSEFSSYNWCQRSAPPPGIGHHRRLLQDSGVPGVQDSPC